MFLLGDGDFLYLYIIIFFFDKIVKCCNVINRNYALWCDNSLAKSFYSFGFQIKSLIRLTDIAEAGAFMFNNTFIYSQCVSRSGFNPS